MLLSKSDLRRKCPVGYHRRTEDALGLGGDKGGRIVRRPGGVAYNIAQKLAMLGTHPLILSVLGNDTEGKELCETCNQRVRCAVCLFFRSPANRSIYGN